jgi:hypothetical protein
VARDPKTDDRRDLSPEDSTLRPPAIRVVMPGWITGGSTTNALCERFARSATRVDRRPTFGQFRRNGTIWPHCTRQSRGVIDKTRLCRPLRAEQRSLKVTSTLTETRNHVQHQSPGDRVRLHRSGNQRRRNGLTFPYDPDDRAQIPGRAGCHSLASRVTMGSDSARPVIRAPLSNPLRRGPARRVTPAPHDGGYRDRGHAARAHRDHGRVGPTRRDCGRMAKFAATAEVWPGSPRTAGT